ncbi:MAG: hypothetical protein A2V79_10145 [Betaproteobacteria bacterium RBG_16_56_24]|nr:MAG: hypothetical protein A2V79_10145 [Betaproteobacteria bacterium RBG_16_56_24]OGT18497.1 MAG: hypothetical protein A3J49_09845 [Gallionellales bacterium RIFCSPHIGHO2_02_FULL_57_16]
MTTFTETVSTPDHAVIARTGMTLDTVFQTVLFIAYSLMHRFIALVQEQVHVIYAHPLRIFYTLTALADIELGHAVAFCSARSRAATENQQRCEQL